MSLLERMKKTSTIKDASAMLDADVYDVENIPTNIPMLNLAFSGMVDGGLTSGITMLAGESRTFKTGFLVQMGKSFQDKYEDGVILFFDSEFSPMDYWESGGCDMGRILHVPITSIEQLKHELSVQLDALTKEDNVIILIDSIGAIASKKEIEDAMKSDAQPVDMTRAKALNSLFRIVTPQVNVKKIPMVLINSFYETMEMYAKRIYAGGKKVLLSCDDVFFISKSQVKEGSEKVGNMFTITADKSRTIREGSKFPVKITVKDGIDRYSNLYELAKEFGYIVPAGAWCKLMDLDTGELATTNTRVSAVPNEFYDKLLLNTEFQDSVSSKYLLSAINGE